MSNDSRFLDWPMSLWMWPWLIMDTLGKQFVSFAPGQTILPGWFANSISVTEQNSSSPETERDIVSAHSYGQQLGVMMDAVAELVAESVQRRPKPVREVKAFQNLVKLHGEVDAIKTQGTIHRTRRLIDELGKLKERDRGEYDRLVAVLRSSLEASAGGGVSQSEGT